MADERQLTLTPLSFGCGSGNQIVPVVLTSGMSDEEIKRVRAIMFPPPPLPTKINLMANPEFIEIASVLASKLDHIRYERRKATIFVQRGVRAHCNELMKAIGFQTNVDEWFSDIRGGDLDYDPTDPNTDIKKTQFTTEMQRDWIQLLIDKELETPGFCKVLYNCLDLEERIGTRLKSQNRVIMGSLGAASGY